MQLEHRLSALLQQLLHSQLNTGFNGLGKGDCKSRREIFVFGGIGAAYKTELTPGTPVASQGALVM